MAKKKRLGFSFRTILMILTAILVGYVIKQNWRDILETLNQLQNTNVLVLLLLVPGQLFMYYACGQIFFAFLRGQRGVKKVSDTEILRISTELNFVTHAIPAGGVGGLAFLTYRLSELGVSAGQTSFLYVFRYAITTIVNYVQALVAIVALLIFGLIPGEAMLVIPVALLMNVAVFFFLWFVTYIADSNKRITFFARIIERITNKAASLFTFGRKKWLIKSEKITRYFVDIHHSAKFAKVNRKLLARSAWWGLIYSFCEIGIYWIVAISLGRPELLPFIMVGEAIGSVFDGIIPYGLYELGMAGVMIALGVDFPTATIVTVMTRVITLLFTIVSGIIPYYETIRRQR